MDPEPQRTVIDGIPAWCADTDAPLMAALMFRVGRVDETLTTAGITHLVEHLACHPFGRTLYRSNAFVDLNRTVFWASGDRDEVAAFLSGICRNLQSLPLDRLESETGILRTEASNSPSGTSSGLWRRRFGAERYGLLDFPQWGLRSLNADDVSRWSSNYFTAGNAVLWANRPLDGSFDLELPPGPRNPLPVPAPREGVITPTHYFEGQSNVAVTMLTTRSPVLALALDCLERRAFERLRMDLGVSYGVGLNRIILDAQNAYAVLAADGAGEKAAEIASELATVIQQMADGDLSATELDQARGVRLKGYEDPMVAPAEAEIAALDELFGLPRQPASVWREGLGAVTREDAVQGLRTIMGTALMAIPPGTPPPPAPFAAELPWTSFEMVKGHSAKQWLALDPNKTVIGPLGISRKPSDGAVVSVLWDRCVGVFVNFAGRHEVVDKTGQSVLVSPWAFVDGQDLIDAIHEYAPPDVFVSMDDDGDRWLDLWALSRQQLSEMPEQWRNLLDLASQLREGERPLILARGMHNQFHGLLALTNKRVLHVSPRRESARRILYWWLEKVMGVDSGRFGVAGGRVVLTMKEGPQAVFLNIKPRERAADFSTGIAEQLVAGGDGGATA